jgi:hypothetical protein
MGSDGKLYHADSTDLTTAGLAVGISTGAASQGESVNYQYRGIMTNEGWNLTEKQPVYFGSNGIITQTVPTGYIQRIGTAITSTKILIQIDTYIVRG